MNRGEIREVLERTVDFVPDVLVDAVEQMLSQQRESILPPMQTRTILHVGDREICSFAGEPPHEGHWVHHDGRLYIASKVIWQYAAMFGVCTVDVLLAPIPASLLSGIARQSYDTARGPDRVSDTLAVGTEGGGPGR